MTDPVIPPEAVEAVAREIHVIASGGLKWEQLTPSTQALIRDVARLALAAAFPHLPARQIGDELAPELRQEVRTVMELGRALGKAEGRQEAAEEIAVACEKARELYDAAMDSGGERSYALAGTSIGLTKAAHIAREVAIRTADARPDPSGHTDLPPTPDAGSKRLPGDTGKGDSA